MKKALVVGATGQDGSLICKYLLEQGYEVHGTFRRGSTDKFWRINEMGIREKVTFHNYNVGNELAFAEIVKKLAPDELYSLAGESFTALSFEEPKHFMNINIDSVIEQLDAVRNYSPNTKIFFASSSEVFGESDIHTKLHENSPMIPKTPYGISKLTQLHLVRLYREKYNLKLFSGILFPHESPYRSSEFVTRKITLGMIHRIHGKGDPLVMGDLNMVRDWGAASQYVKWMNHLLVKGQPGDYVFGSGINSKVESYLFSVANFMGLNLEARQVKGSNGITEYVDTNSGRLIATSDNEKFKANRFSYGPADRSKLEQQIGAQSQVNLDNIVREMVQMELERFKKSF